MVGWGDMWEVEKESRWAAARGVTAVEGVKQGGIVSWQWRHTSPQQPRNLVSYQRPALYFDSCPFSCNE